MSDSNPFGVTISVKWPGMRTAALALAIATCGCDRPPLAPAREVRDDAPELAAPARAPVQPSWSESSNAVGVSLSLRAGSGTAVLQLACTSGSGVVTASVPAFRPISSQERLSLGSDGEVLTLVADPARAGDGVTGSGAVPSGLKPLLSGALSASYGAQTSGPHPPPSSEQARAFARACASSSQPVAEIAKAAAPGPCLVQDNKPVPAKALRAVGTEPFWGARIEGRCVTYSHPDDQAGTRVWARFDAEGGGGRWTGALGGRPFVLRSRPQPGCSDGMSDRVYPLEVRLTVDGEERRGCAEPL